MEEFWSWMVVRIAEQCARAWRNWAVPLKMAKMVHFVKYNLLCFLKGDLWLGNCKALKNKQAKTLQPRLFLGHTTLHYLKNLNITGLSYSLKNIVAEKSLSPLSNRVFLFHSCPVTDRASRGIFRHLLIFLSFSPCSSQGGGHPLCQVT